MKDKRERGECCVLGAEKNIRDKKTPARGRLLSNGGWKAFLPSDW